MIFENHRDYDSIPIFIDPAWMGLFQDDILPLNLSQDSDYKDYRKEDFVYFFHENIQVKLISSLYQIIYQAGDFVDVILN